jgi:hypothetical protein
MQRFGQGGRRSRQGRPTIAQVVRLFMCREADDHASVRLFAQEGHARRSCDCVRDDHASRATVHVQGGRRSRKSCDCHVQGGDDRASRALFMCREADDHASRATVRARGSDDHAGRATVHVQGGRRSRKSCDCSCTGSPTITQVAFLLVIVGLPPRSIGAESSSGSLEAGSRSHRSDPKRRGKWSRPTRSTATSMCGTG